MYAKTTLENGIRVVTESMAEASTLTIGILVDAGPRDELPGQSGLAHLTEHAVFQGTSSRDALQIARLMDSAGGQMGAFTTRDYTCYHASVLDDFRTYALDLFGDLLLNSTFPAASLEREKQSILREIDAQRDAPRGRLDALLKAVTWPDHPLGRSIAGEPGAVQKLSRDDVIYFMFEHYLPNRIIIAGAGHVEHADFVAQVRDAFWRLLGQNQPAPERPARQRAAVACENAPVKQAYFALGIPARPFADADRVELHVLNALLGGGISSRLFRNVREEKGLVHDIGSEYQAYRDNGLLVVEGSTAPEHLNSVLELTLDQLSGLASWTDPVGEEELWKAKMQLRGQHSMGAESTYTRMSRLATQEFYFGKRIPPEQLLSRLGQIDVSHLERKATELLGRALPETTLAVVGPDAPGDYSQASLERLLARHSVSPSQGGSCAPTPPQVAGQPQPAGQHV